MLTDRYSACSRTPRLRSGPSPPSSHPSMPSSRSTSFSLPASEHPASSLTADAAGSPTGGTKTVAAGEVEEDEEEMTPEQEAKHREFVKARGALLGPPPAVFMLAISDAVWFHRPALQ